MMYLSVLAGFGLLFLGGETLVRGAVALAERLQVSNVLIGLTVVAVGTSVPELSVSVDAALRGSPDIAVGNVVGSNISNILLVLGATALIHELRPETRLVMRDGLFLLAVTVALAAVGLTGAITAGQGALFVVLLGAYIGYSYWAEELRRPPAAHRREDEVDEYRSVPPQFIYAVPMLLAGFVCVVLGAELLVGGAIALARDWGVSEAVIGLSMIAVGTSLPELAVSAVAAFRGRGDVAVGNIVGSNISNILGILGITALVTPLPVAHQISAYDVWVMVLVTLALIPTLLNGRRLSRTEGTVFLAVFAVYIASLYAGVPEIVMEKTLPLF